MISLSDIESAQKRIAGAVTRTQFSRTEHFPETGCAQLHFKFENEQRTGSFKERGALNKLLQLTDAEKAAGVVSASAGNHAQGVAYHAGRLGISTTIVMPERTPLIKASRTRGYGANVILKGNGFDEAFDEAVRVQKAEGRTFVHPFDDDQVMAGQGTVGLELLEQFRHLEVVVVPIGGGGLISGIALALKETNPRIQVIGVQPAVMPAMKASLEAGHVVHLQPAQTIADGLAVKRPGKLTFEVIRKYVDDIVTVEEEELAAAILLLLEREKSVVEGAGAAGLAALLSGRIPQAKGKKTGVILCGGNIDVNLVSRIIERGLVKDGRLVRLKVTLPDRPGMLARFVTAIAEHGANVVEIYHHRAFSPVSLGEVQVEAMLETRGVDHVAELKAALSQQGWQVTQ
ncbi:MAG: threonine ammonia-lyase [Deltaproteobacteria bacterium]|nr:threonine ammonia-lyase [Deltaproteobacteria bacterium]